MAKSRSRPGTRASVATETHRWGIYSQRALRRIDARLVNFLAEWNSDPPPRGKYRLQLIRQALHRVLLKFPAREDHALGRRKPRS